MRKTIVLALHLWRPPGDRHRTLLRTTTQRLSVPALMILQHRRAHWMLPGYALLPISVASRVYVCFSCYCSTRILSWYALNYSGVISWTTYLRSSHTCSSAFNNFGHITIGYTTLHIMTMFPSSPCPVVPKFVVSSHYYMLIYTSLIVFLVIIQLLNWILSQTVNPFSSCLPFWTTRILALHRISYSTRQSKVIWNLEGKIHLSSH